MLINFSIQNFGSIKEKQTLSFEADKSRHLEDYYVIHTNGLRLLKLGLIYGANASGKTTILKALDFLRTLVLKPKSQKTETFDFEPFLFDEDTPRQNTIFEIDFLQNSVRYLYEVELNKKSIVKEVLSRFKTPNKKSKAEVFVRTIEAEKQLVKINFGSNIELDETDLKALTANTLWNNTVLGGFLKTNIESKELIEVENWFKEYLSDIIYTQTDLEGIITESIEGGYVNKTAIFDILKKADFNITDIIIKKADSRFLSPLKVNRLEFQHTVRDKSYSLSFNNESQGTQRYYSFAGLLYLSIRQPIVLSIDELESSLHPDLYQHFLLSFLINSKQSQIIATTHNREILNDKDIFRNDAIWITDKDNEDCATELYSLADFGSNVIRDTTNILNAYKLGKLGGVPNLGDYYIDIEGYEEE